jgi:hypothetical protein
MLPPSFIQFAEDAAPVDDYLCLGEVVHRYLRLCGTKEMTHGEFIRYLKESVFAPLSRASATTQDLDLCMSAGGAPFRFPLDFNDFLLFYPQIQIKAK